MSEYLSPPTDLVLVGHIIDAQGIRGLIKVKPYSKEPQALFAASQVWLTKPPMAALDARPFKLKSAKEHSGHVVIGLDGCLDRDQALLLKGHEVYVSRAEFPKTEGDYYWVDLIGLPVFNLQGVPLGVVRDMMDNGAQSILCVRLDEDKEDRLIPFVDSVIDSVQLNDGLVPGKITLDWQLDW
jgi:16S rRNA processing protein RimM